jgi:acyl carrier protein
MDLNSFIKNMADQFDELNGLELSESTNFKTLVDYSSLTALNIISMIDDEYGVYLKGDDIRNSNSILDLFEIVKAKSQG